MGSGLYISGQAESKNVDWLVDTGCSVTILSEKIFHKIHPDDRPELHPPSKQLLSADGSPMKVLGESMFNISVGHKTVSHFTIVAEISNDGLLGIDFLKQHSFSIDFKTNQLICENETFSAYCKTGQYRACRVSMSEHTMIPAGTRTIVRAKTSKPLAHGSWLVEPLSRPPGDQPVLTAKVLVQGLQKTIPVEILNPSNENVYLHKNTNLGIASRVFDQDVVAQISTSDSCEKSKTSTSEMPTSDKSTLPSELQKLVDSIDSDLSTNQKSTVEQLLLQNSSVFATKDKPFGHTDLVQHSIQTEVNHPIKQPVRRPPLHLRSEAQSEVQNMLEQGVIEPSDSPWASPVVLVRKKDGSLRYCIDYRKLNDVTIKDSYPLPRIDESLDSLSNTKFFSTLDLASGYWQIGLDEDAKKKSAFCTTSGLFQFKVMPFGLTNAPATFQRLMERVLAGLQWQICLVYIDDVIIFSETFDDHINHLSTVFSRLDQAGLKLKPKKCFLFQTEVKYLGHVVSQKGISTDPDKIKAVRDWPTPQDVTDVKKFLGLCSYYRRFVPDFATISKPLTQLTEKNSTFQWGETQQFSFDTLKNLLISAPIMSYPQSSSPFILDTDASSTGIGAVLSQIIQGEERVIAYGSRVLTKAERQYCVTRREMLAVVYFTRYFKHYLLGQKFLLRTDHASLRWLKSFKEPEGQVARWLQILDTFHFDLQHRPGAKHSNADALSRLPTCDQCRLHHYDPKTRRGKPITKTFTDLDTARPVQTRARQKSDPVTQTSNWLPDTSLSKESIKQAQMSDPVISVVIDWVSKGQRPDFSEIRAESRELKFFYEHFTSLKIVEGILLRELDPPDMTIRRQICLPPSLHSEALHSCHSSITAGHFGKSKTLENVKRRFIWSGMHKSVQIYCMQCDICAKFKTDGKKRRASLNPQVTGTPMERVCIDILGPYPPSIHGSKYALVVTDYFTKYVEIFPLPNQEATSVATVLVRDFFSRYGVPHFLHSDQGTQFESKLFQEICDLLGITKTRTTPFRPQSDGLSERNIKTLSRMIAMTASNQAAWDEHLPFLSMAYRATPQSSTGLSPNYLMYGREISMPVDVMIGAPIDQPKSELDYVKNLQSKLTEAYKLARLNLKSSALRQKKYYNAHAHGSSFQVGDSVWYANKLRKVGVSPKLQPKWRGPCLVVKRYNDCLVHIQLSAKKSVTVHTDLLKSCYSTKLPGWFRRKRRQLLS